MPIYRLASIDVRSEDPKWAVSTLKEPVWVEAPDALVARHLVEGGTLKTIDFKLGQKLIFSPWIDDVVTSCWPDRETKIPPEGHLLTADGKTMKLHV